jgi:hypothetical protein
VYIATQAGTSASRSASVARRTAGDGGTLGAAVVTSSGCRARMSRAGPHAGSRRDHSASTASAAPTIDEHTRPWARARWANADRASGVAAIGIRFAPE